MTTTPLRILSIIPSGYVFGLQHITLDFFKHFSDSVQSHFVVTRWNDGEFVQHLSALNIPYSFSWLGMFSRRLDPHNLRMSAECLVKLPQLYLDVRRVVNRFQPHLFYMANHHELILLAPLLATLDVPVICHMHDPPPAIPFQRASARFIYDPVVAHYIAISESVKDRLEQLGIHGRKITTLYNGIDLDAIPFIPERGDHFIRAADWPNEVIIVGMTGQMIESKGHKDLLHAVAQLKESHPNLRIVFGGKEQGDYVNELRVLVAQLGLAERVYFAGWQEQVSTFFSGIDIFVLASRHEEGFGLVVAEAMATGRPVIATQSGGAVEVVIENENGYLVGKNSPDQLATKLVTLADSSALRHRMGYKGRQHVKERFDLVRQSRAVETFLHTYR